MNRRGTLCPLHADARAVMFTTVYVRSLPGAQYDLVRVYTSSTHKRSRTYEVYMILVLWTLDQYYCTINTTVVLV